jgi:signal peptidase I
MQLRELEVFSDAELDSMLRILDSYMQSADSRHIAGPAAQAKRSVKRRAGSIVSAVLFYGLLLCLVGGAFLLSQGDKKPILGYSFMNVITPSMQSVIPMGSLVVVKEVGRDTIRIGDDITFMKDAETTVTHRVIGITEDYEGSGERGFETQGVDNDAPDFEIVRAANVVGVVKFHVQRVGEWLEWLRGNLVITLCFTAGFLLLAVLLKGAFRKSPENQNEPKEKKKTQTQRHRPFSNLAHY